MTLDDFRIRHALRIAFLLGTASAAALANQPSTLVSGPRTPMCYCRCEHGAGARLCTKMCDLAKYEKRWWATSCHRKSFSVKEAESPNSTSPSRKTNRTELARKEVLSNSVRFVLSGRQ